ncbi:MAG TPA: TlpA family protein disulfide reductase [Salinimicrobium catena]|uniref:TlpA family protein disulfide reductase n=1 Tax=Salinimicrobium catena TaxID=390640 RepID=A0A7C2RMY2_9FLAO|nr:TlpA family protein disulfide reductase [Salinimicrobium catena]
MKILTSKKTIVLFITCLTIFACNSPADISGRLEGVKEEGLKLYLIKPGSLKELAASYLGKVIDSTVVDSNGHFEFRNLPMAKEPVLLELAVARPGKATNFLISDDPVYSNYMPVIWHSEPLQITAEVNRFQNSLSIQDPSEANKALLELRDINLAAYENYLAGKQWQVKDGSELLEKEHAVLQYQTQLIQFANSTKHLLPALVALRWVSPEGNYERVPEFLVNQCEKWKKVQPDHSWVKQLCQASDPADLPVLEGDAFPDFQLPTLNKDTISLKKQLGEKLTIIDLWASWCAPCRRENREVLVPLWEEYHDQGLQIIAYGLESDEATWRKAAERDGADRWLQASDLQGDDAAFLKKIRVKIIPANFILDDKGVVIAKNVYGEALTNLVESYLRKE